jgi:type I restriction enzyme S subunit
MANDWRPSTWGDEVTLEYGKALRGYSRTCGKYRVFGSNGPIGWTSDALAPGPGVVLGRKGAYRGVEFCRDPFWVIDTAYYLVPKTDLDMRWLYYAVKYYKLGDVDDGSPVPSTTRAAVYMLELDVPHKQEQQAISRIIGTLDDKIELNRKKNETLEAMVRALFKAWFVDFEPVHAKMEGRWQRGQSRPGMPEHLYDIFPDRLIESEIGMIPEGWRHSTIGEEVTVCGGSTPSTKESEFWENGHHCWATPKDLSALKFPVLFDTNRKITDFGLAKINSGLLPVGTVLLSSRAPIGYLALTEVPTAINQGFIAMKCDGALPNVFVLSWCRESMDAIIGNANGSTFQEISKSNFRPLRIVVPSPPALASFTKAAGSLYRQLAENERESRSIAQLRDTLLPKLISGELRIGDADKYLRGIV